MDKKQIMIGVAVVCIIAAGAITYFNTAGGGSGQGVDSIDPSEMTWMKCQKCNSTYEMPKKEYYKYLQENMTGSSPPPLPCQECGEKGAYRAVKCESCGNIFYYGASGPQAFPDKCPKCGFSATEDRRKNK